MPPKVLQPYVPKGLELDTLEGQAFASFIGFDFRNTAVKGIKVPGLINFPEINLRLYVKRGPERGVCFVKEIVPKWLITQAANWLYNEHYATHPCYANHQATPEGKHFAYGTQVKGRWHRLEAFTGPQAVLPTHPLDDFFKEQTWGYGTTRGGKTLKYAVRHPRWCVYPLQRYHLEADFGALYGPQFAFLNHTEPFHVMLAEGSAIEVYGAQPL
jgi:hypothetical protein